MTKSEYRKNDEAQIEASGEKGTFYFIGLLRAQQTLDARFQQLLEPRSAFHPATRPANAGR